MFSLLRPYSFGSDMFMDPTLCIREPKRRRVPSGRTRAPSDVTSGRYSPATLRYEVEEDDRGYVLSIYKALPKHLLRNEINNDLSIMKDQLYRPVYHYNRLLGNLIEEETDEDLLTRQAMSRLNVAAICRRVARQAFKDYKIELNHRGDGLSIVSHFDAVLKEFDLGVVIDDLEVVGCQLDKSCTQAVWRILLVEAGKKSPLCGSISVQGNTKNGRQSQEENNIHGVQELGDELSNIQESETLLHSELDSEPELILEPPYKDSEQSDPELGEGLGMEAYRPLKIDVDFCHKEKSTRYKRDLPLLEEVEDEEVNRFKELVRRAPAGSVLFEDCSEL